MKLRGILGSGTGKLGNSVFTSVAGEQIVRQYQPSVANPNTSAQVEQRSKFKLASQIASVMAPAIAIPRKGLISSRNAFVKQNFPFIYQDNDGAKITLENIQLTNGSRGLPMITGTRSQAGALTISLANSAAPNISRVVYTVFRKNSEAELEVLRSVVVVREEDGQTNDDFETVIGGCDGDIVVYGYGMSDLSSAASAKYGNMHITDGLDLARLAANRELSASDFAFTQTRGAQLTANQVNFNSIPVGNYRVYLMVSGQGGNVTAEINGQQVPYVGNGSNRRFNFETSYPAGTAIELTATPEGDGVFDGWYMQGAIAPFSYDSDVTVELERTTDIVAKFHYDYDVIEVPQP